MAVDIDTLQIKIESDSSKAVTGIDKLAATLERLKTATKGVGLGSMSTQMKALADAAEKLAGAKSASGKIQSLANSLNTMSRVPSLAAVSRQLTSLGEGMQALSNANFSSAKVQAVGGMLTGLASVPKLTGMTTVSKQLTNLASGLTALGAAPIDQSKIQSIVTAMNTLSTIGKVTGLNSTINALKKLPAISADLQRMDLTLFAQQMERVAAAMRPLASEMARVAAGFAAFPIRIQRLIAENDRLFNSNRRVGRSFGFLGSGLASVMGYYYSLKRIGSIFGNWVNQSTAYVENLNLFTVAMGEGADEAIKYAETVQEALGIDMSEFIKNQGVFKQVLSGFGVASDKANLMSKNLTQLGYDISSYFNISIESAMEKLQSGIAGQVRPLRDVGYAIEMATLQEVAYAHGIDMSVSKMSQAQKSQLRYVAIMEQSKNAMGDMARTIMTPANALRIVGEQVKQLGRAIGDTLIPIIMTVLPYIQALIELLTEAFRALASFMGFEIPKIDYSGIEGIGGAGEDAENALDGATEAAKELKNATLGIDELNILSPAVDSGKGSMDGTFGDDLGLELPEYDFLKGFRKQTDEIKEQLKILLNDYIIPIGTALAAWKITGLLSDLSKFLGGLSNLSKFITAAVIIGLEFKFVYDSYSNFLSENGTLYDLLKSLFTIGAASWLLYSLFGPAGITLGISVGVLAILSSLAGKLASGKLKVGDFKTWLTAAIVTALGGIAGMSASKFIPGLAMAKGTLIGLSVGAALALSVINISAIWGGQYSAWGIQSVLLTALSSVFAGIAGATIALATGIATAGVGFVVGAGIALVLNIAAISIAGWSASVKEDLAKRFGEIELTAEESRALAEKTLSTEWYPKVKVHLEVIDGLEEVKRTIENSLDEINQLNWKASIGLDLTENDQSSYKANIESYINNLEQYVEDRGYGISLGVNASIDDETTAASIISSSNAITQLVSNDLTSLGKKLQVTINDAFDDGILTIDEQAVIQSLTTQLNEITEIISQSKIEAKLDMLDLKYGGAQLTPESYLAYQEELNAVSEEMKADTEESINHTLSELRANINIAEYYLKQDPSSIEYQNMLIDAENSLQSYMDSNPFEVRANELDLTVSDSFFSTIGTTFKDELNLLKPVLDQDVQGLLADIFEFGRPETVQLLQSNVHSLTNAVATELYNAIDEIDVTPQARAEIAELLEAMQPTIEQREQLASEYLSSGKMVPNSLATGISDIKEMQALAGNMDALNYLVGEKLSTDPSYLNMLATVEGAGMGVDENIASGILNNIKLVTDETTGVIVGIKDTVSNKVIELTPEMVQNLKDLGLNLSDGLLEGVDSQMKANQSEWTRIGSDVKSGLLNGIGDLFQTGANLGAQLVKGTRSAKGIDSHSPSKAFYDVGLDSIAGLQNGMAGITDVGASIGSGLVSTMVSGISESTPQIVTAAQSIADSVQKVFDGVTYDPLINYMELINAAKEAGDLASAAHYETIRNAKIAGERITEYAPTYDFTEAFQPAAEELTKSNAFLGSLTDYSLKTNDMTAADMADWTARYNETNAWQTELMGNLHDWFSDWTNLYETLDNRMLTAISQGMARNASGLSAINATNLNGFSSTLREIQTAANRIVASTDQIRIEVYYGSKLDGFASGGFPAQGQMFVAREAGPELVGTIGGRTAVANDGQIISGIREGVADANEQQNALLREQNELLREILSKTGTYINGKQVTNLVEKTQRERGASIMTGGVMFR